MKVFHVCGNSKTGKTTVTQEIIRRLAEQGYQVASMKSIHTPDFHLDQSGKDTYVHHQNGANPVAACGHDETGIIYYQQMDFFEVMNNITADWLVAEGFSHVTLPKIVCAKTESELGKRVDRRTFAISGIISNKLNEYNGIPVYNPFRNDDMDRLIEQIQLNVFPVLPFVADDQCRYCGLTCSQFVEAVIQNERKYSECIVNRFRISGKMNGEDYAISETVKRTMNNYIITHVLPSSNINEPHNIEIKITT